MRSPLLLLLAWLGSVGWAPQTFAASTYSQNFDSNTAPGWSSTSAAGVQTFTAAAGYYTNDNHNTPWTIATYDGDTWTSDYTYTVSLNSQFGGGTANAVGAVYGYQDSGNYYKVWFNMLGEADIYRVTGGTATQVAHTTTLSIPAKTWFTVQIIRKGTLTSVLVNDTPVFASIPQPEITSAGKLGVIAEWNYAQFDNVAVTLNGYSENFADNTAQNWSAKSFDGAQTFTAANGYYTNDNHDTQWTQATYDGAVWDTNFDYSVDLNAQFGGGTANTVAAIYGYRDSNNYYKVWFNMLGTAEIDRVVGGAATLVVQGSPPASTVSKGAWFTVKISRSGTNTSVTVNGKPLFTNISQPEITYTGKIGVRAEWNFGQFDNVMVVPNGGTLYATDGPPFPRLAAIRIGVPFDWDTASEQQTLAQFHIALLGYFSGWTNSVRKLDTAVQNIKANTAFPNFPTKVFLYIDNEEFHDDTTSNQTIPELRDDLTNNKWWLFDGHGNRVQDPFGGGSTNFLANTTQFTQDASGNPYAWVNTYGDWVFRNFWGPNHSIDGFYTDNFGVLPLADGDYNNDGTSDSKVVAGPWFRSGMQQHVKHLRAQLATQNGPQTELANIGDWGAPAATFPEYLNLLNGGVLEGYIGKSFGPEAGNGTWLGMLNQYRKVMAAVLAPRYLIFNTSAVVTDYPTIRYGLTSCLMDDGYFSLSDGDPNHVGYGTAPVFDEYKVSLGYPTDPPPTGPWQNGVWRRSFQNGTVLVNPKGNNNNAPVTVTLEPGYKHFSGSQDPTTNNGAAVTTVTLQPRDGVILVKSP